MENTIGAVLSKTWTIHIRLCSFFFFFWKIGLYEKGKNFYQSKKFVFEFSHAGLIFLDSKICHRQEEFRKSDGVFMKLFSFFFLNSLNSSYKKISFVLSTSSMWKLKCHRQQKEKKKHFYYSRILLANILMSNRKRKVYTIL